MCALVTGVQTCALPISTGERLAEGMAAFHRGLRRHVGVDVERQNRPADVQERQRNAERVVDLGGAGEGRIEPLLLQIADQVKRSEEHTSELQSLMRTSYAVFC